MDVYITRQLKSVLVLPHWVGEEFSVPSAARLAAFGPQSSRSGVCRQASWLLPACQAGLLITTRRRAAALLAVINTLEEMSLTEHLNKTASAARSPGGQG